MIEQVEKQAIALKYPTEAPAPFITAKGKGRLAEYILKQAKQSDVEIVKNSSLINLLNVEDVGNYIPETAWKAVASIFAFMYSEVKTD